MSQSLESTLYFARKRGSITFPLVYALLLDCRTTTYARLFRCLRAEVEEKNHGTPLTSTVQIDFEQATIWTSRVESHFMCHMAQMTMFFVSAVSRIMCSEKRM
ncbi:hypothetical protein ScPMuIL_014472 [Solemya velum]